MEIVLLLLQVPLLIFLIKYVRKLNTDPLLVNSYYYLLSFKVTAGLVLGIIFFNYYGYGDQVAYLRDLEFLNKVFYSSPLDYCKLIFLREIPSGITEGSIYYFNDIRAYAFIRVISPLYIFSGSSYWMLSIYLSLFSFTGLWILANTLIKLYKINATVILISFFIYPSVVFWSSGVMKESFSMGMMAIVISMMLNLANRQNNFTVLKFILLLLFFGFLLIIKYYYLAALIAVLFPYAFVKYLSGTIEILKENKSFRIILFFMVVLVASFVASFSHPLLNPSKIAESLYSNYSITLIGCDQISFYTFEGLSADPGSFIQHIPKSVIYGIFGPFLGQKNNLLMFINEFENAILLILFVTFILNNLKKERLVKIDLEIISLLLYTIVLASFMAFASPNWGTLVRYKVGYLPFFLLAILNNNSLVYFIERRLNFLLKRS